MLTGPIGPEIRTSALVIVDMQNDFVHADGGFAHRAREHPEAKIDMPFLMSTIPHVKRLAEAFRRAGRPVVYVIQVLRPDYADAAFPYWRATKGSTSGNRPFIVLACGLYRMAPRNGSRATPYRA